MVSCVWLDFVFFFLSKLNRSNLKISYAQNYSDQLNLIFHSVFTEPLLLTRRILECIYIVWYFTENYTMRVQWEDKQTNKTSTLTVFLVVREGCTESLANDNSEVYAGYRPCEGRPRSFWLCSQREPALARIWTIAKPIQSFKYCSLGAYWSFFLYCQLLFFLFILFFKNQ